MSTYNMEKLMNVQLQHGGTNECKAIAWRNKWMSTYNMEKLMNVQLQDGGTNGCQPITWINK